MTRGPVCQHDGHPWECQHGYRVTLERIADGSRFCYGFTSHDRAERFRERYTAPLPDRAPNPYRVGQVIAR